MAKGKKRTLLRISDAENACSARTTAYFLSLHNEVYFSNKSINVQEL